MFLYVSLLARFIQLRTQFFNAIPLPTHIPSISHCSATEFQVACCVDRSRPLVHFSNSLLATGINLPIIIIHNINYDYHFLLFRVFVARKIPKTTQKYLLSVGSVIISEIFSVSPYLPKLNIFKYIECSKENCTKLNLIKLTQSQLTSKAFKEHKKLRWLC